MPAKPLHATKRKKARTSFVGEVAAISEQLGFPLLDWQERILSVGLEFDAKGRPFYDTVVFTVCRQQGKTIMMRALMVWWAMRFPDQVIVYCAQTRMDAAERVKDLGRAILRSGMADVKVSMGVGNERLQFANGSTVTVISPNAHGAHGSSIDLAVLDEAWAVKPVVLEGIVPARSARPNSQMWVMSTMGTEDSEFFNDIIAKGRDGADRLAYFEWGADEDAGDDVFNPDHWERWMPSLGVVTPVESIKAAMAPLTAHGFKRAYGNVLTASEEELIPPGWWEDAFNPYADVSGDVVYGFDVNLDPAGASIAACVPGADGGWHVGILEYRAGESGLWLAEALVKKITSRRPLAVVAAGGSPSRAIADKIKVLCSQRDIPYRSLAVQDLAAAAGLFYDSLRSGTVTHGESESLDLAAARARSKPSGDQWLFDRAGSRVDVSPIVAASVALYGAQEALAKKPSPALYGLV